MGETNGRPPAMLLAGWRFPFFHYANCPWLGLITTAPRFCRCKEPGMGYPRWQRQRNRVCIFATRHPGLGPGIHTLHSSFSPRRESRALIEGRNGCDDGAPPAAGPPCLCRADSRIPNLSHWRQKPRISVATRITDWANPPTTRCVPGQIGPGCHPGHTRTRC